MSQPNEGHGHTSDMERRWYVSISLSSVGKEYAVFADQEVGALQLVAILRWYLPHLPRLRQQTLLPFWSIWPPLVRIRNLKRSVLSSLCSYRAL
jgi:hypothetical protein